MIVQKGKTKIEHEQALMIYSDDPEKTIKSLSSLSKLGWMVFKEKPDLNIKDTYINTLNRDISSSIRIRNINGEDFITIKGKNVSLNGDSNRKEFEVKWPWEEVSPWDFVDLFDLYITQERQTHRIVRDIYNYQAKKLIAELAIDTTTYIFDKDRTATLHEVEIEMSDDAKVDLKSITELFTKNYPELKLWKHSKFSTGDVLDIALSINADEKGFIKKDSFTDLSLLLALVKG